MFPYNRARGANENWQIVEILQYASIAVAVAGARSRLEIGEIPEMGDIFFRLIYKAPNY